MSAVVKKTSRDHSCKPHPSQWRWRVWLARLRSDE